MATATRWKSRCRVRLFKLKAHLSRGMVMDFTDVKNIALEK